MMAKNPVVHRQTILPMPLVLSPQREITIHPAQQPSAPNLLVDTAGAAGAANANSWATQCRRHGPCSFNAFTRGGRHGKAKRRASSTCSVRRGKLLDNSELLVSKPARDSSRGPTPFSPSFLFVNPHLRINMASHIKPPRANQ